MPDFTIDAPAIGIDGDTGLPNPDDVLAFSVWLAAQNHNMPDFGSFDPTLGVPHFVKDGARFFSVIATTLIKFYLRHQTTIDPYLSSALNLAMDNLAALLGEIILIDQVGPN